MQRRLKRIFLAALLLLLVGCFAPAPLQWEESVVMPDGRVVVLKRVQHFDEGDYVAAHSLEFQHPVTKQKITWQNDGFFRLVALFMVQNVPYILVKPTFAVHNEYAGCPYPRMLIYKYVGPDWQQIPYAASPIESIDENVTVDPKAERDYIKASNSKLAAGKIKVRRDAVLPHEHGLYLKKFPTQVFQCPLQKRIDLH